MIKFTLFVHQQYWYIYLFLKHKPHWCEFRQKNSTWICRNKLTELHITCIILKSFFHINNIVYASWRTVLLIYKKCVCILYFYILHIYNQVIKDKKNNQDVGSFNYARNKTVQQLEQWSELAVLKRVLSW